MTAFTIDLSPIVQLTRPEFLKLYAASIPDDLRAHYQILRQKREAETLTDAEYNTLIQLSNEIEKIGAQRFKALCNLAQLRQVSLPNLIESLGIQPVTYV